MYILRFVRIIQSSQQLLDALEAFSCLHQLMQFTDDNGIYEMAFTDAGS